MSTSIAGFRPPDKLWQEMKDVWDACKKARIDPPQEVYDFFVGVPPDPRGIKVSQRELGKAVQLYKEGTCEGFEVEIAKLPKNVTHIRFYNSW